MSNCYVLASVPRCSWSSGSAPLLTRLGRQGRLSRPDRLRRPVRTEIVFAFARWLIRDWESHGLKKEPETYPKQPGIRENGCGNWMRVTGRHHKRDHWSRVWDGDAVARGQRGDRLILTTKGTAQS